MIERKTHTPHKHRSHKGRLQHNKAFWKISLGNDEKRPERDILQSGIMQFTELPLNPF